MENEIDIEHKRVLLGHYLAEVKYKETLQKSIIRFAMTYLKYLNTEKPDYWMEEWSADEGYKYKRYEKLTELDTNQVIDIFLSAEAYLENLPKGLKKSFEILYNDYWLCGLIESVIDTPYLSGHSHRSTHMDRNVLFKFLEYGIIYWGSDDLDTLKEKIEKLTEELKL